MKVAFYKARGTGLKLVYGAAVRAIDQGPYSHCEIVFSDGMCASASYIDSGVRFKRIEFDDGKWDFLEVPDLLEPMARAWFTNNEGLPYDLRGNLRFVLPWERDSGKKYFCSESIAAALGWSEPWRYGPNGLFVTLLDFLCMRSTLEILEEAHAAAAELA